jgi:maleate isomerase
LQDLCGAGADAIVQVGTDLVMTRLADEAERWLGRPVVAVNAAMLWHALRTSGMSDQMRDVGSLLREH